MNCCKYFSFKNIIKRKKIEKGLETIFKLLLYKQFCKVFVQMLSINNEVIC